MTRRRTREADRILPVIQFLGGLIILGLILPPVREVIFGLGLTGAVLLGLAFIPLIGLGLCRWVARAFDAVPVGVEGAASSGAVQLRASAPSLARPVAVPPPQPHHPKLVEQLHSIDWFQFEKLVALLYRKLGFTVSRRGGANPDGGIDLVIEKGGQKLAVQCKQWKTWNVGVKAVREFLGALTDAGIPRGVFITLRGYSSDAKQLAQKHGIEVLDQTELERMLEAAQARFDPEVFALLRDPRKFCPKCEREMILRTATKGPGIGKQFWGCSGYPRCHFTMQKQE